MFSVVKKKKIGRDRMEKFMLEEFINNLNYTYIKQLMIVLVRLL